MSAGPAPAQSIGIDLVEIDRVERAIERRPRLAERLFTEAEREYAAAYRRPARRLAARFAAKEAAIKALGLKTGIPAEIEVVAGEPPTLALSGAARAAAEERGVELSVSLSHEREHAVAVVLAQRTSRSGTENDPLRDVRSGGGADEAGAG